MNKEYTIPFLLMVLLVLLLFVGQIVGQFRGTDPDREAWRGRTAATSTPQPALIQVTGTPWWEQATPTPFDLSTPTQTPTATRRKP